MVFAAFAEICTNSELRGTQCLNVWKSPQATLLRASCEILKLSCNASMRLSFKAVHGYWISNDIYLEEKMWLMSLTREKSRFLIRFATLVPLLFLQLYNVMAGVWVVFPGQCIPLLGCLAPTRKAKRKNGICNLNGKLPQGFKKNVKGCGTSGCITN